MGGAHSRDGLLESSDEEFEENENEEANYEDANEGEDSEKRVKTPSSVDEVEAKLKALKLKYAVKNQNPNAVKLYLHIGGNSPNAKWVISEKFTTYSFVKTRCVGGNSDDDEDEEEDGDDDADEGFWVLKIGSKIRSKVGGDMQLKTLADQRRVDFIANGVWAMKFFSEQDFNAFLVKFQNCTFENTHGYEATDENKLKVYGKDFLGWAKPEVADESMWEDADDSFSKSPGSATPVRASQDLREEFEEAANGGIQSLALGALDNSFLVGENGIQVVKNFATGIHGKGAFVNFGGGSSSTSKLVDCTPKKTLLMKAETSMLLMSPLGENKLHSTGLHQFDIETGKVVTEWRFGKDGTEITMKDITNDSKGAQLDPSGSTFLGLDDNRLCRWDMRDRHGIVQDLADSNSNMSTPVLNWAQGHQFSRGTNFQCFATTGDGSVVVGSLDGKIRLYSINSMRQAKTAFPGLGSPVTNVDVTFDGKWIVGTTDTYLVVICTVFTDKDGKTKNGFAGRMGNNIAAPRLLKLNPLDSHLAGVNNKFQKAQFSWVSISFLLACLLLFPLLSCKLRMMVSSIAVNYQLFSSFCVLIAYPLSKESILCCNMCFRATDFMCFINCVAMHNTRTDYRNITQLSEQLVCNMLLFANCFMRCYHINSIELYCI